MQGLKLNVFFLNLYFFLYIYDNNVVGQGCIINLECNSVGKYSFKDSILPKFLNPKNDDFSTVFIICFLNIGLNSSCL